MEGNLTNWRESRGAWGPLQGERTALVKPPGRRHCGGQGPREGQCPRAQAEFDRVGKTPVGGTSNCHRFLGGIYHYFHFKKCNPPRPPKKQWKPKLRDVQGLTLDHALMSLAELGLKPMPGSPHPAGCHYPITIYPKSFRESHHISDLQDILQFSHFQASNSY